MYTVPLRRIWIFYHPLTMKGILNGIYMMISSDMTSVLQITSPTNGTDAIVRVSAKIIALIFVFIIGPPLN